MRHAEVKVGADIWHQLPGGKVGKYLGTVEHIGDTVIRYRDAEGNPGIATAPEITQSGP